MERITSAQVGTGEALGDSANFTGPVRTQPVHAVTDPFAVRALVVSFEAGARTHWHSHAGGQILHVVSGRGRTRSQGGEEIELSPGDIVVAAPNEEHWHGAAEGASMTHLAVSLGDTSWSGPPE